MPPAANPPTLSAPSQVTLNRLVASIKKLGGRELPEDHNPVVLKDLAYPQMDPAETSGCKHQTRFRLPYKGENHHPGSVIACAVCDGAAKWPVLA